MAVRALRGAITVDAGTPEEIRKRTTDLLTVLLERNDLSTDDFISIIFTVTPDITSLPPAAVAREFGLDDVPLICAREMGSDAGIPLCIRLLAHIETDRPRADLDHVFLRGATVLRPELTQPGDETR